ncbi:MAG TPA: twin-arginine translocase subunit TatC [Pirellulales bacterium]|nr:twin-arginine translocase subunit TatC [Pirellulales bacterium]
MTPKPNEDLFQDTTMTFGEHLEELRVALFKALLGLIAGCVVGLFVGSWMVSIILGPLESALETYYAGNSIKKYDEWVAERQSKNLPVPYTHEQIVQLVNHDRMLFEIMYVDPRQAWQEATRLNPQWIGKLPMPAEAERKPESQPAETLATATSPPAVQDKQAEAAEPLISAGLAPVLMFHPGAEDDRVHAKSFSFPEMFTIWLKACLVVGTILSSPWVFYQIWNFVASGLYPHEKKYVHLFLPFSLGLFLLGAATAYLFVFKPVLGFLLTFNSSLGVDPDPRISEWLGFVLLLPLGFGISFQLPLVMLFLERIGIFNIRTYMEKWRVAVLVIFIISAILTPADPYSILFMALPLTFLYFGGVLLCYFLPKHNSQ